MFDVNTGSELHRGQECGTYLRPDDDGSAVYGAEQRNDELHFFRILLRPEDLLNDACSRVTRNLTYKEWSAYLSGEPYERTCPNLPDPPDLPVG